MSRGLYTAASGMVTGMQRQLELANLVANINTPGYKGERTVTRSFPEVLAQASKGGGTTRMGTGVVLERAGVDLTPGTRVDTGNALDVALEGNGFFVAQDGAANLRLTRDGHFRVGAEGFLTTSAGFQLLSTDNTPIQVGSGPVAIQQDGSVVVAGAVAGRLRLVNPPEGALLRVGESSFGVEDVAALDDAAPTVLSGKLEQSNVNSTQALTEMVSVARAYDSAQRLFAMQNQILGRTVTEVGRV